MQSLWVHEKTSGFILYSLEISQKNQLLREERERAGKTSFKKLEFARTCEQDGRLATLVGSLFHSAAGTIKPVLKKISGGGGGKKIRT